MKLLPRTRPPIYRGRGQSPPDFPAPKVLMTCCQRHFVPLVACGKGSGENKTEIKLTKIKKLKSIKRGMRDIKIIYDWGLIHGSCLFRRPFLMWLHL